VHLCISSAIAFEKLSAASKSLTFKHLHVVLSSCVATQTPCTCPRTITRCLTTHHPQPPHCVQFTQREGVPTRFPRYMMYAQSCEMPAACACVCMHTQVIPTGVTVFTLPSAAAQASCTDSLNTFNTILFDTQMSRLLACAFLLAALPAVLCQPGPEASLLRQISTGAKDRLVDSTSGA
jgi:hypothetical protein